MNARPVEGIIRKARTTQRSFEVARRQFSQDMVRHYHDLLAESVTHASPMLFDLAAAWSIDLEPLLRRLRPPRRWLADNHARIFDMPARTLGKGANGERMRVVVIGDGIQVRAGLGDGHAVTRGGVLNVWLLERWPEAIMSAVVGLPLADVVDHAVLRMRPYPILRSYLVGNGTVVEASAPDLDFRVPWASAV